MSSQLPSTMSAYEFRTLMANQYGEETVQAVLGGKTTELSTQTALKSSVLSMVYKSFAEQDAFAKRHFNWQGLAAEVDAYYVNRLQALYSQTTPAPAQSRPAAPARRDEDQKAPAASLSNRNIRPTEMPIQFTIQNADFENREPVNLVCNWKTVAGLVAGVAVLLTTIYSHQ